MIAVGKNLKATRIEVDIENTIVVDVTGLSEQIRIIGVYWPQGQKRELDDLRPYLVKSTILTGDFNATAVEWDSKATDRRGGMLKKWIEANNLNFVASTAHSSRRSDRHIDLTFTNINSASCETLSEGNKRPLAYSVYYPQHRLSDVRNLPADQLASVSSHSRTARRNTGQENCRSKRMINGTRSTFVSWQP